MTDIWKLFEEFKLNPTQFFDYIHNSINQARRLNNIHNILAYIDDHSLTKIESVVLKLESENGTFWELLKEHQLDPDYLFDFIHESLAQSRKFEELHAVLTNQSEYINKKLFLFKVEALIIRLERKYFKHKMS